MDIASFCPLRVAGRPFQTARGSYALLVVCKATYLLAPGASNLHHEQEDPCEEDNHWDDDTQRSLYAASDFAPAKRGADVVLVGHAFSPNGMPMRSFLTRLCVAELDKAIEVFGDRLYTPHGELREGARITRARLRYERAAGGPGTSNPVGMRHDLKDAFGAIQMPSLQPPGRHVTRPDELVEPIGYGPIAPSWPFRQSRLGALANVLSPSRWYDAPLPDNLDPWFFNVAPNDQEIRELRPDERIVLEGLHPDHPRLVTNLPGLRPRAVVERASGQREEINLVADTLWFDTTRGICTVVWRGCAALAHPAEAGRVVVTMEGPGVAAAAPSPPPAPAAFQVESTFIDDDATFVGAELPASPTLPFRASAPAVMPFAQPFAQPPEPPRRRPSSVGLPFSAPTNQPLPSPPSPPNPPSQPPMRPPVQDLPFATPWPQQAPPMPPAPPPVFPKQDLPFVSPNVPSFAPPPPPPPPTPLATPAPPAPPTPLAAPPPPPAPPAFVPAPLSILGRPAAPPPSAPPPAPPVPPAPPAFVPASAPAMIGPLATPEMVARHAPPPPPPAEPEPAPAPPPPAPAKEPAPPALPLDEYPIDRCAKITASIARRRDERAEILEAEELNLARWAELEKHWTDSIQAEIALGKTKLLKLFDAAYVARLEEERGPIMPVEFARLAVASERGQSARMLAELGLPRASMLRIERVFLARSLEDPTLGEKLRRAIDVERDT